MKLLHRASTIYDRVVDSMAIMGFGVIIFIMLSVATEVTARYVFNVSIEWVHEITEYGLLYVTMLVAAWVLRRERHVKMEVVFNRFPPRTQLMLNVITSLIIAIVFAIITWYGTLCTIQYFQAGRYTATPLELPVWPTMVIIPVGSSVLFIQLLRRAHGNLRRFKQHDDGNQSAT